MKKKIIVLIIVCACIAFLLALYFGLIKKDSNEIISSNKNAELMQTYVINFDKNNAIDISTDMASCVPENGVCTIKTPTIKENKDYIVLGWSINKDAKEKEYDMDVDIEVSSNMTLYAIVKEIEKNDIDKNEVCNTNTINSSVKVVNIAYSQIGYKEKNSDKSINSCTSNSGDNNINKYGNSGNAWQYAFVNWCYKYAGIDLKITNLDNSDEFIKKAKDSNTWFTSKSMLHDGDIVVTNNTIGIAVKIDDNWNMILGNINNRVDIKEREDEIGYISMNKKAY